MNHGTLLPQNPYRVYGSRQHRCAENYKYHSRICKRYCYSKLPFTLIASKVTTLWQERNAYIIIIIIKTKIVAVHLQTSIQSQQCGQNNNTHNK